jgi:catechol 2,3-dioxygenase-like lactoylglutathione lyase family enzyme
MIHGLDHLIILVDDLDTATQQYTDLGFTVTPGGKHPRHTHNALISFADGTYIELIAFWQEGMESDPWFQLTTLGGGLIDHALLVTGLSEEVAAARQRGVTLSSPIDGARTRPDGVELAWRMSGFDGRKGQATPFLIEDVTDRDLRVPTGQAKEHKNGVTGVDTLIVVVDDVDTVADHYSRLIQGPAEAVDVGSSARGMRLNVGSQTVQLIQPLAAGPMLTQLQERGGGPYAAILRGSRAFGVNPAEAGNARLEVVSA